jgi:hypothetical protein
MQLGVRNIDIGLLGSALNNFVVRMNERPIWGRLLDCRNVGLWVIAALLAD